ncbi:hypothetical protein KFK09_024114 [Dendrobium nobile]|uniref:Uncharacterized protein n=1 Tax=Dendrobium nobile TaxID=94219 RepID=A0A8T3AD75_DENNO|nr:hypothetical protein KFK09_024114 [Dendrobium nobile]
METDSWQLLAGLPLIIHQPSLNKSPIAGNTFGSKVKRIAREEVDPDIKKFQKPLIIRKGFNPNVHRNLQLKERKRSQLLFEAVLYVLNVIEDGNLNSEYKSDNVLVSIDRGDVNRIIESDWDLFHHPVEGTSEGILVLWNKNLMSFNVVEHYSQLVFGVPETISKVCWNVVTVFGNKEFHAWRRLWESLEKIVVDGVPTINKKGFMAVKLEMAQAYDSMGWKILKYVLKWFSFPDKISNLIMECVVNEGMFEGKGAIIEGDSLNVIKFLQNSMKKSTWQAYTSISEKLSFPNDFNKVFSTILQENAIRVLSAVNLKGVDDVCDMGEPNGDILDNPNPEDNDEKEVDKDMEVISKAENKIGGVAKEDTPAIIGKDIVGETVSVHKGRNKFAVLKDLVEEGANVYAVDVGDGSVQPNNIGDVDEDPSGFSIAGKNVVCSLTTHAPDMKPMGESKEESSATIKVKLAKKLRGHGPIKLVLRGKKIDVEVEELEVVNRGVWRIATIYGGKEVVMRSILWEKLEAFSSINLHMEVGGDFNCILSKENKRGDKNRNLSGWTIPIYSLDDNDRELINKELTMEEVESTSQKINVGKSAILFGKHVKTRKRKSIEYIMGFKVVKDFNYLSVMVVLRRIGK